MLRVLGSTWCQNTKWMLPRYVKSRSDQQLLNGLKYNDTSSCNPEGLNNGLPIIPCGLIAWSLFNDTYTFFRETLELKVNKKNIAWKSDREDKFGKHVYPFNFQNGTMIGGGKLDPSVPVSVILSLNYLMNSSFCNLGTFRRRFSKILSLLCLWNCSCSFDFNFTSAAKL